MTKQAIINALELCENGEQMLQFLEGLSDYQQQSWISLTLCLRQHYGGTKCPLFMSYR
jgi:hypothetical protein